MRIASFFSGIGGLELGLEEALGAKTVFQCEIDPFARSVLERHWPGVRRHDDITTLDPRDIPDAEVWCGGFPCDDLSDAGSGWERPGLQGARSGLWSTWRRLIASRRPGALCIENVDGAAWKRWVPSLRRDLHCIGYAVLPLRVRSGALGARFEGSRVFALAAPHRDGESARAIHAQVARLPEPAGARRRDWGQPPARALGVAHGTSRRVDGRRRAAVGRAVSPPSAAEAGRVLISIMEGAV